MKKILALAIMAVLIMQATPKGKLTFEPVVSVNKQTQIVTPKLNTNWSKIKDLFQ